MLLLLEWAAMSRRPWRNTRAGGGTERMWQVEASQGGSAANRGSQGSDITAWDQFPKKLEMFHSRWAKNKILHQTATHYVLRLK